MRFRDERDFIDDGEIGKVGAREPNTEGDRLRAEKLVREELHSKFSIFASQIEEVNVSYDGFSQNFIVSVALIPSLKIKYRKAKRKEGAD